MATFSFKRDVKGQDTYLTFSGPLNEQAELPNSDLLTKTIFINCKEMNLITSVGTKKWWQWLRGVQAPTKIILEECQPIFVKSFSSVKGMLNENVEVASFYVPFYGDQSGESKGFLAVLGKHFKKGDATVTLPEVRDSKNLVMEIDVVPSYFDFLKR